MDILNDLNGNFIHFCVKKNIKYRDNKEKFKPKKNF